MKTVLWIVFAVFTSLWSGLAFVLYKAIGAAGRGVALNADLPALDPEWVEWLSNMGLATASVGEWFVLGLWAAGLLVVFIAVVVIQRLITRRRAEPQSPAR